MDSDRVFVERCALFDRGEKTLLSVSGERMPVGWRTHKSKEKLWFGRMHLAAAVGNCGACTASFPSPVEPMATLHLHLTCSMASSRHDLHTFLLFKDIYIERDSEIF